MVYPQKCTSNACLELLYTANHYIVWLAIYIHNTSNYTVNDSIHTINYTIKQPTIYFCNYKLYTIHIHGYIMAQHGLKLKRGMPIEADYSFPKHIQTTWFYENALDIRYWIYIYIWQIWILTIRIMTSREKTELPIDEWRFLTRILGFHHVVHLASIPSLSYNSASCQYYVFVPLKASCSWQLDERCKDARWEISVGVWELRPFLIHKSGHVHTIKGPGQRRHLGKTL